MPTAKRNLNPTGLGRAIINRKAQDARKAQESGLYTTDVDPATRLKSVTQEGDLDAFLNNAQLAGREFTAERRNIRIVQSNPGTNPHLLNEEEEASALRRQQENKARLRVPRRHPWTKGITLAQLDRQEKDSFLEWRRDLAILQERDKFLLTPFERNLEVWRQLWRVLERSHLVVQIVDARNPRRFRCEDLEAYVMDVEGAEGEQGTGKGKRRNLLLINKADLLTAKQRHLWADYFDQQGVQYAFFSAENAAILQQSRREALNQNPDESHPDETSVPPVGGDPSSQAHEGEGEEDERSSDEASEPPLSEGSDSEEEIVENIELEDDSLDDQDARIRVLSVPELEALFEKVAPDLATFADSSGNPPPKLVVGLVGYPNVGKSSTINTLLGEKKVSVSSTPGKTKHFQTIHLSANIVLCDCPGLVFPQFATTKADLVCDGVLPIDQMREHTGPTALVVRRIPKEVLEAIYGLSIKVESVEEGGTGQITAENLLIAYAIARGFTRSGQGNPDEARAARYILKDYVSAKILFCHPPPGISEPAFNEQTYTRILLQAAGKKRAPVTRVGKEADTYIAPAVSPPVPGRPTQDISHKVQALDQEFFAHNSNLSARPFVQGNNRDGQGFTRPRMYPHQNAVADDGTALGGGEPLLFQNGPMIAAGKKNHKKPKRMKQRGGKGYD